ncbi:4'-phosphopantetheinyl transferase superfamily protein [Paenibacillus sp. N4]|uniref:4'-phosphopantetheinyl transferase family protein n=1 Tax=Paenibacillus vietnamensis TaxID=2590547 RepID=UPI001CD0FEBA|nr:4'-phosphopantetheinyl transferase superfamily protein [Paenibacillus vietnamensis]MCA0757849.1 4'-phosphopantetheinyl transferase superfamily protein [Paenibacillus vietnamensis]
MTSIYGKQTETFRFTAKDEPGRAYKACVSLCRIPMIETYNEIVNELQPPEMDYYRTLRAERRQRSYLLGRYTAKRASALWLGEEDADKIVIDRGIFTQPIVVHAGSANIQVSITHCGDIGISIAFPEAMPLGIDLEKADPRQSRSLEAHMTAGELEAVRELPYDGPAKLMVLWTAKEALSKILKTGLLIRFELLELQVCEAREGFILCSYEGFPQYRAVSFVIGEFVCSVAYPARAIIPDEDWLCFRRRLEKYI